MKKSFWRSLFTRRGRTQSVGVVLSRPSLEKLESRLAPAVVNIVGTTLTFQDAGTELNTVTITRDAAGDIFITDTSTNPTIGVAPGWSVMGDTASGPDAGITLFQILLGGGNDTLVLGEWIDGQPTSIVIDMGAGNDTVTIQGGAANGVQLNSVVAGDAINITSNSILFSTTDIAQITTTSANVVLNAQAGILLHDAAITTDSGNITLSAGTTINEAASTTATKIITTTGAVDLTAAAGIGLGPNGPIDVTIPSAVGLTANVTAIGMALVSTDSIFLNTITVGPGVINVTATSGDITVGDLTASAIAGSIVLNAQAGNVLDDGVAGTDLRALTANLSGVGVGTLAAPIEIDVTFLLGTVTTGGFFVVENDLTFGNGLTIQDVNSTTGAVNIVLDSPGVADINLLQDAITTTTGSVTLTNRTGSIVDFPADQNPKIVSSGGAITLITEAVGGNVGMDPAVTMLDTEIEVFGAGSVTVRTRGEVAIRGDGTTPLTSLSLTVDPGSVPMGTNYVIEDFTGITALLTSDGTDLSVFQFQATTATSLAVATTTATGANGGIILWTGIQTTGAGNITVTARRYLYLDIDQQITTGTGTVTLRANEANFGNHAFIMGIGSSITTNNATPSAVLIRVNGMGGTGTGGADLTSITTGSGGTITVSTTATVDTAGGSITQLPGNMLNTGTGTINLSTRLGDGINLSGIGLPDEFIQTTAQTITAFASLGGIFIFETDGMDFTGQAMGDDINVGNGTGTLNIDGHTITGNGGNITITSGDAVMVSADVGGMLGIIVQSGRILIVANLDNDGPEGFTQVFPSSISTTNTDNDPAQGLAAIRILVNSGSVGSGGAVIGNIATGNGGRLVIRTGSGTGAGGSITNWGNAHLLYTGSGLINLATPNDGASSIGSSAFPVGYIHTETGELTAFAGSGGIFIREEDGMLFNGTARGDGDIRVVNETGTLQVNGRVYTLNGDIDLRSGDALIIGTNGFIGFDLPGVDDSNFAGKVLLWANTDDSGSQGFTQFGAIFTINTTAFAVQILVNDINPNSSMGSGGAVVNHIIARDGNTGGTITVTTGMGQGFGGSITRNFFGTHLLDTIGGRVVLTTPYFEDVAMMVPVQTTSGIGSAFAPILTRSTFIDAQTGAGGCYITDITGANFKATAQGSGNVVLTTTNGDLVVYGQVATATGNITLNADDGCVVNSLIGGVTNTESFSGILNIFVNLDGIGSDNYLQNLGGIIISLNPTPNAILIRVNRALLGINNGTGGATLANINVVGTLSVFTDGREAGLFNTTGGSINQFPSTLLVASTVILETPTAGPANVGTSLNPILTQADFVTLTAAAGGAFVTEADSASFDISAQGAGNIGVITRAGTLTVLGDITTGTGTISFHANSLGLGPGAGFNQLPGTIISTANTTGSAISVVVNANTFAGGTGGALLGAMTTGNTGTITVRTDAAGVNTTGGSINNNGDPAGILNTGTVSLRTPLGARGIGNLAMILTQATTVNSITGNLGVFIEEQDGANFTATSQGAGAINLSSIIGTLAIVGATTTGTGPITLTSGDAVHVNATLGGAGFGGTINIHANTDGDGNEGFIQGTNFTTTGGSITITVNEAGGGTGTAALRNITTVSGGTITVTTNTGGNTTGGSITAIPGSLINAGTGTVILTASAAISGLPSVGSAGSPMNVQAATVVASAGAGGVFLTENSANPTTQFTATASNVGNILISRANGALVIAGATFTGSGATTLTSGGDVFLNAPVGNGGTSGPITISANTDSAGLQSVTQNPGGNIVTSNNTAAAVTINVNTPGGGFGDANLRNITTGVNGQVTIRTFNGAVIGTNSNIVAGGAVFLATGSIGTLMNPVNTTVRMLQAQGGANGIFINNTGILAIGGLGIVTGVQASGPIQIVTTSNLTVNETVHSTGGSTLLQASNIITLNAGVRGTTANVLGSAGNDTYIVNASAGAGVTLNGNGSADIYIVNFGALSGPVSINDAVGSNTGIFNGTAGNDTFTVLGTSISRNGTETVSLFGLTAITVNGLAGDDTFNVTPSATVSMTINGDEPSVPTPVGDRLNVNTPGATGTTLTKDSPYSGVFTFSNRQQIAFTGIENLDGEKLVNTSVLAVSQDNGGSPEVFVYDSESRTLKFSFFAYDPAFRGGVRVALGDVNGDGVLDIITAPGPGGLPHIRTFDGRDGTQIPGPLGSFFAFNSGFRGGTWVASGDLNNDGFGDIIVGADAGAGPHVKAFSGQTGAEMASFFAFGTGFLGGVRVGSGDINGDGNDDIIAGAGPGGLPHVRVFNANGTQITGPLGSFLAYEGAFEGGIYVSGGDVNGDGRDDVITGAGLGGGPHIRAFSGMDGSVISSFFAYDPSFFGGCRVATLVNGNSNQALILTGPGPGGPPNVRAFNGVTAEQVDSFFAFDPNFTGGIFVAGGR